MPEPRDRERYWLDNLQRGDLEMEVWDWARWNEIVSLVMEQGKFIKHNFTMFAKYKLLYDHSLKNLGENDNDF